MFLFADYQTHLAGSVLRDSQYHWFSYWIDTNFNQSWCCQYQYDTTTFYKGNFKLLM